MTDEAALLLRAANEQLVQAALRAESVAEAAISDLGLLTRVSQRDVLTGLPNRALMHDRIDSAIAAAQRHGTQLAVLFIDLDQFKQINDTLGHAVGDDVLRRVAQRLEAAVRHSDTVSRYGGDEFVVLLPDVAHAVAVAGMAAKLLAAVSAPAPAVSSVPGVSASIGIALYPADGTDAAVLLRHADAAMYRAKHRGAGRWDFHTPGAALQAPPSVGTVPLPDTAAGASQAALATLRDANEGLVLAVLKARQLEEDARDADRRKNEFLALLAHELRNPLAPMANAVRILRRQRESGEPSSETAIAMIERQLGQMVRLVDDLLDVGRISHGKIVLRKEPLDLGAAVQHAVDGAGLTESGGQHQWRVMVPLQPLILNFDPTRLTQVLGNVLNNAMKFTPAGGTITLTVERQGNDAVLRVADTGIGIAAEQLGRVFEMFVQADSSLERLSSGLGIGLAVVKDLMALHGASVAVSSAGLGQGSTFTLRLPLAADQHAALPAPAAEQPSVPVAVALRILVVDDNVDAADSLAAVLTLSDHTVLVVHDGPAALAAALEFQPDVVLLDIGLPQMNGREVARRLRQQPRGAWMLLVALTGWGQPEDRAKSAAAGFDAHLLKPLDFDALQSLLAPRVPSGLH